MEELDALIAEATGAIADMYFQLPIAGGPAIFRERVYCYELYHQLRMRWPAGCPYSINGEVDKRAHPILRGMEAEAEFTIPDFLVHTPGNMAGNHAIIEVKPMNAKPRGVLKDLETLSLFRRVVGYQRAIYLFYGGINVLGVRAIAAKIDNLQPIELWLHPAPGHAAELVDIVA